MKSLKFILVLIGWVSLTGCHDFSKQFSGEYCNLGSKNLRCNRFPQIQVSKINGNRLSIEIQDSDTQALLKLQVIKVDSTLVRLELSDHTIAGLPDFQSNEPFLIKKISAKPKEYELRNDRWILKLVLKNQGRNFGIQILNSDHEKVFQITGTETLKAADSKLRKGANFTLTLEQLLDLVASESYQGKIELQKVRQAKLRTYEVASLMLPQVGLGALLSIGAGSPGLTFVFDNVFSLALPTGWLRLFETKAYYTAQKYESQTNLANLLFQTETLAYRLDLHEAIKSELKEMSTQLESALAENQHEELHSLIKRKIIQMGMKIESLEQLTLREKLTLGEFVGLHMPEELTGIRIGASTRGELWERSLDRSMEQFLGRSIELRKFEEVKRALKFHKIWQVISVFDPSRVSGSFLNPKGAIGYVTAKSHQSELMTLREKFISESRGLIYQATTENQRIQENWDRTSQWLDQSKFILKNSLKRAIDSGDTSSLEMDLENWIEAMTYLHSQKAQLRLSQATLDRLVLGGAYYRMFGI